MLIGEGTGHWAFRLPTDCLRSRMEPGKPRVRSIKRSGYDLIFERVESEISLSRSGREMEPGDFGLHDAAPHFNGMDALRLADRGDWTSLSYLFPARSENRPPLPPKSHQPKVSNSCVVQIHLHLNCPSRLGAGEGIATGLPPSRVTDFLRLSRGERLSALESKQKFMYEWINYTVNMNSPALPMFLLIVVECVVERAAPIFHAENCSLCSPAKNKRQLLLR